MSVSFNHHRLPQGQTRSAEFLARILGLPKPQAMWSFVTVPLDNGVTLDFLGSAGAIAPQHYACPFPRAAVHPQ
ncbi:hypothetical protein [Arthrobacter sp. 31Y]|uniref:hypothetical protein n=1 Tax=Arthrobacter sp. 31Y TaxID=1115632 RepID=UPI0004B350D9|nr:hypothetical protein [Arthrobacter sp. 31Y]